MAGAREIGEVHSYPLHDSVDTPYEDSGFVLVAPQDGSGAVRRTDTATTADIDGTHPVVGVSFASHEDQYSSPIRPSYELPESGEQDVVSESAGYPVKAEDLTYELGEDVYLSDTDDGRVTNDPPTDADGVPTTARVGRTAEAGGVSSEGKILVKFDTS